MGIGLPFPPDLPRPARAAQAAGGLHRTTRVGGSKSWAAARTFLCLESFFCVWTQKKGFRHKKKIQRTGQVWPIQAGWLPRNLFFVSGPGEEPASEEFELITALDPEYFFVSRHKKAYHFQGCKKKSRFGLPSYKKKLDKKAGTSGTIKKLAKS